MLKKTRFMQQCNSTYIGSSFLKDKKTKGNKRTGEQAEVRKIVSVLTIFTLNSSVERLFLLYLPQI